MVPALPAYCSKIGTVTADLNLDLTEIHRCYTHRVRSTIFESAVRESCLTMPILSKTFSPCCSTLGLNVRTFKLLRDSSNSVIPRAVGAVPRDRRRLQMSLTERSIGCRAPDGSSLHDNEQRIQTLRSGVLLH